MLRVEARTRLGALRARRRRARRRPAAAWRSPGRRARARARCCGSRRGCCGPRTGGSCTATRSGSTRRAGATSRPELRGCGYVFQDYALFGHMQVWQNVAYGLRGMSRGERRRRADELLERFGIAALASARPATLSGGERQRVALARALAPAPRALLLDEPLSALDARTRASASRELAAVLREASVPALLVTHDFTEAAVLGDRVAVIDGGRIVQEGTAGELAAAPASAFVADFTGAVVLTGVAREGDRRADGRRPRRRRQRDEHRPADGAGRAERASVGDRARARGRALRGLGAEPPAGGGRHGDGGRQPRARRPRRRRSRSSRRSRARRSAGCTSSRACA